MDCLGMASLTPPSASAKVTHGSCLCKAVHYTITGDPIRPTHICHCINCQKATGSAFMWNGGFIKTQIKVVQGEESLTTYSDKETRSGYALERIFCKNCGSNLFVKSLKAEMEGRNVMGVPMGCLDGPTDWMPNREVFTEQQVQFAEGILRRNEPGHCSADK